MSLRVILYQSRFSLTTPWFARLVAKLDRFFGTDREFDTWIWFVAYGEVYAPIRSSRF